MRTESWKRTRFYRLFSLMLILAVWMGISLHTPLQTWAKSNKSVIEVYEEDYPVEEDEWYDTMEEVAVYIAKYEKLPENYITKSEAKKLGWVSSEGNLWDVALGCSIGGDHFGNYEGLLPEAKKRSYTECDIEFEGDYRNGKRIIFSNDGLIYYTDDHYKSFTEVKVFLED